MSGSDSDSKPPPPVDDEGADVAVAGDGADDGTNVIESSDRFAGLGEAIAAAAAEAEVAADKLDDRPGADPVDADAPVPTGQGGFKPRLVLGGSGGTEGGAGPGGGGDDDGSDDDIDEAAAQLLEDLDRLQGERNEYLEQLLRTKADFENYRKRVQKQQAEQVERAAEELVEKLLEVLDVFDGARTHASGFEQVGSTLVGLLEKEGLVRIDPAGAAFDPTEADAVMHEEGDDGPVVSDVLRPGYRWKGRVLRPAMVKVRG